MKVSTEYNNYQAQIIENYSIQNMNEQHQSSSQQRQSLPTAQDKKKPANLEIPLQPSQCLKETEGTTQQTDVVVSCVREFMPKAHSNGISRSQLKVRMHMTRCNGASKKSTAIHDEELIQAMEEVKKLITEQGELLLKNHGSIPKALFKARFDQVTVLDIRSNGLTAIDEGLCRNLTQIRKLDARGNKIKEISPHIKAIMTLQILRLDSNLLEELPSEIGELCYLEELTLQDNKVKDLPANIFHKLYDSLRILNIADNKIKHLPQELGNLRSLKALYLHGNRFTSFPCSLAGLLKGSLEELSLEWFLYAKPPRPKLVKKGVNDGDELFEQLLVLCNLLVKYKMNECALITFLENYSNTASSPFQVDHVDNRLRTPLHNAAVKGDVGVVEGLLLGKANPNTLDKDNCTPLCLAIREDRFDAAVILINAQGVDVNMGGGIFGSPMHLAVVKLEVWIVKKLLMRGADVNKADCDGNTPLHLVKNVFSKNAQKCMNICELLISHGARANIKNNDNWAPIHIAARKGQEKGIQTIIRINQMLREQNHSENCFDLNVPGGVQSWTSLHLAAHGGHFQIVKDLVLSGADVFQRNNNNHLPRHCAKGNYILTKYIKLCERSRARTLFQSHMILSHYELLSGVTVKSRLNSAAATPHHHNNIDSWFGAQTPQNANHHSAMPRLQRKMSEATSKNHRTADVDFSNQTLDVVYDTFQTNLAQLKISKQFQELDIVRRRWFFESSLQPNATVDDTTPKPRPSKQQVEQVTKGDDKDQQSRFQKLNHKAEEMKKINLFYLKDILIKPTATYDEKLECLWKIKRNVHKPVFGMAMKALLPDFNKISEILIQRELLSCMACSSFHSLLHPLKELLKMHTLEEQVIDDLHDTISALQVVAKNPKSFVAQPPNMLASNSVASETKGTTGISLTQGNLPFSGKHSDYGALKLGKAAMGLSQKHCTRNAFIHGKARGMTTSLLVPADNNDDDLDCDDCAPQFQIETEVIEDNFALPINRQKGLIMNASMPLSQLFDNNNAPQRQGNTQHNSLDVQPVRALHYNPHHQQNPFIHRTPIKNSATHHQHQLSQTMVNNQPLLKISQNAFQSKGFHQQDVPISHLAYNTVSNNPGGYAKQINPPQPMMMQQSKLYEMTGASGISINNIGVAHPITLQQQQNHSSGISASIPYHNIISANFGVMHGHKVGRSIAIESGGGENRHHQRNSVSIPSKK